MRNCVVPEDRDSPDARAGGLPIALVVTIALIGVAIRAFVLASPLGRPDADEVVTGLMARHLLSDGYPQFLWGQHYGGTIEVLPVAISLRLLGSSVPAMRVPVISLAVANSLLVWRVARRLLPEDQAQIAGLLFWIGAPAAAWLGVREMLLYSPLTALGLTLALLAFRWRDDASLRDAALFGLVAGVGWWTSPTILYYLLPASAVVVLGGRFGARWRHTAVATVTALVGAAPWLHDNIASRGGSLKAGETFPTIGTYPERFAHFFSHGLPAILGWRETFTYEWVLGPVGVVGYIGVVGVLAFGVARALRAKAWDGIALIVFPFVFAWIPFVMDDPNLRYLLFVVPFVAVVIARVAVGRRAQVASLALALVVTGVGMQRLYAVSELDGSRFRIGNAGDLGRAIDVLDGEHIDAVYGDYWVAYRIAFESQERIIATPSWGIDRYEPYTARVRASPRVAWVVEAGSQRDALLRRLGELDVRAAELAAGEFAVVIPARPVTPDELPDAARRP